MKKRFRHTKIFAIIALASLMLTFISCSDENNDTYQSQPLVSLTVDTSRYLSEGYVDLTLCNNSGFDVYIGEDMFNLFVFKDDGWHYIPHEGVDKEMDIRYTFAAGAIKNASIKLSDKSLPAGKYMYVTGYYNIPFYNYDGTHMENYEIEKYATAIFELPEREAE